jgi:hypothetical protein
LSEDSLEKDRTVLLMLRETINSQSAHGQVSGRELRSKGDSIKETTDALFGKKKRRQELSVGQENKLLLKDSPTMDSTALSIRQVQDNGASVLLEKKPCSQLTSSGQSSISRMHSNQRHSQDKDKNAQPSLTNKTSSQNASGKER